MPSRNCRTRPLSWKIANNEKLADAVREGSWIVSWVFVNVIASTDNAGRMEGGKYQLRDMFFPHHEDILPDNVDRCINILHRYGLLIHYRSEKGVWLIQLPKVGNFSQIKGNMSLDSDFPPPTSNDIKEWEAAFKEEYTPLAVKKPEKSRDNPASFVVVECWNQHSRLPNARFMTATRQERLTVRWKSKAFREHYQTAIQKLSDSEFCVGQNGTGWRATFDWFIKNDENWLKAYEGKYDNKQRNRFEQY